MSDPSQFYWSRKHIPGFGRMWFPLVLQKADSQGGGEKLLGSVVEENWYGFFNSKGYPSPYLMTSPQIILKALTEKRQVLDLPENIVVESELTAPTYSFQKKQILETGLGLFPSLPTSFKLSIDYSRMKNITVEFGGSTKFKYIPTDYITRLYKNLNGDDRKIDPNVGISIAENYIVDQILLADKFSIIFDSESELESQLEAKLKFQNALPENNGKILVQLESRQRIVAQIQNGPSYLIAFKVIEWEDFG